MEKILHMIEKLVSEVSGSNALKILKELLHKENVSEIKLSENIKLSVNEVRSLLYKLHARNLVYSTRKKDKDKGWYIYFWSFNFNHARDLLIMRNKKRLEQLKQIIESNSNTDYYECNNKCIKLDLNEAMNYHFKCPECEQLLMHKDNKNFIENAKKEIEELEKDMDILKLPIKVILGKEEKPTKPKKKVKPKIKPKKKKIKPTKVVKKIKLKKKVKPKKKKIKRKKVVKKIKLKKKVKPKKKISLFGKLKRKIAF